MVEGTRRHVRHPVGKVAANLTPRPCPPEAEIVDHVAAVGGRVFLLLLVDLLHDDTEAVMAFDGVLTPESVSHAGQAAISKSLACQTPRNPVPGPISLSLKRLMK